MNTIRSDSGWAPSPPRLALRPGEVHVWRIRIEAARAELESLNALLDVEERTRADAFKAPHKRLEFIVVRATLRRLLASLAHCEVSGLHFRYGPRGKPAIELPGDGGTLRFNVSHSHGLAVIAIAPDRELGVDLEKLRPEVDIDGLSRRFFSGEEHSAIHARPEAARLRAFYACWARKEALVKAMGDGIAFGLREFVVSVDPDAPAELLSVHGEAGAAAAWSLADLDPGEDYHACVAVPGAPARLYRWEAGPAQDA